MLSEYMTLSDFANFEVVIDKHHNKKMIVVDYQEDGTPIRLAGFYYDLMAPDFEVQEAAFHYYLQLKNELGL